MICFTKSTDLVGDEILAHLPAQLGVGIVCAWPAALPLLAIPRSSCDGVCPPKKNKKWKKKMCEKMNKNKMR